MSSLDGKWRSVYRYHSSTQGESLAFEHEIMFKPGELVGKSARQHDGSEVTLALAEDGRVFTGTWQERTSPKGRYRGKVFHGAIQLLLSEDGHELLGKWVGFNRSHNHVKTGEWRLTRL